MARVNVEQKALSDPRFDLLARLMKSDERDLALGRMVRVWNECIERGTYALPTWVIQTVFNCTEAPEWLVSCDLAERVGSDVVRIKGTEGRVEYLSVKRATARQNGKLGGRPKANRNGTNVGSSGLAKKTPPAPAPAPALKDKKTKDIAASPPVAKAVRTPDPLWDAIVSVTGADASIESVASHIGKVRKALSKAKPSYTAEEVLALPGIASKHLPWSVGRVLTLGEIEKNIQLVRSTGKPVGESVAQQTRPVTPFEMAHGRYNPQTGFERDATGNIITDRLCRDDSCEHCKARRAGGAL